MIQNMDINFKDKDADVVVECTFTEQALLWQLHAPNSTDKAYDIISEWKERSCGINRTVSTITVRYEDGSSKKMPVCVNLSYALIKTNKNRYLRVVFYEASSTLVDHGIVESYVRKSFCKSSTIFIDASIFSHISRL